VANWELLEVPISFCLSNFREVVLMSGIAGVLSRNSDIDLKDVVRKMCSIQSHRGPDGEGIVLDGRVCFGHRLLSLNQIIGKTSEPLYSSDKSILIVTDANIYNSEELRQDLIKKGHFLKTDSDAEVVSFLYQDFGMDCLKYLRGDFSFAIWDNRLRKLFLARDRFGMKPLFYFYDENNGDLLFASESRALMGSGLINKEIDLEGIYHYFFLTFFPQPKTPFKFLKSLLPGSYLVHDVDKKTLTILKYWDIPCVEEKPKYKEEEIVEECSRLLEESVRIRCSENTPISISLSGGMDSCTIAALSKKYQKDISTFTFGFEKEYDNLNEFSLSKLVADKIGSKHHEVRMSGKDIFENLSHMVSHLDTPTAGAILPYFFAKKAKEDGAKVGFRGDGGNSGFQYLIDNKMPSLDRALAFLEVLPQSAEMRLYEEMEKLLSSLKANLRVSNTKINGLLGLLIRYCSFKAGTTNFALMFTRNERQNFFENRSWLSEKGFSDTNYVVSSYYDGKSKNFYERFNYGDFRVYNDQGLPHINSVTSAFSIDLRLPYFDHKLVEFIQNSLPSVLRDKNGIDKYILKRIAVKLLPAEILQKSARGFYMPIHQWLRNGLKPVADDVFSLSTIRKRNIFNYHEIRKVYDQYYILKDPDMSWRKIWTFVVLEYWFRQHYD
jgi:asparagine synthase (glutamine-hydrolysing)